LANEKEQEQPIIIKKIKKGGGGHHGGAWKVAYADFVTAMMAFFLLLWLLNVTTAEEKTAISNYFDPAHPKISRQESGSGGVLGGMSLSRVGAMVTNVQPITTPPPQPYSRGSQQSGEQKSGDDEASDKPTTQSLEGQGTEIDVEAMTELEKEKLEKQLEAIEDERFEAAMEQIKNAIEETPQLAELSEHLLMDITPEGLRIQIVDKDGRSMFPVGSADMYPFMDDLISKVSAVITALPNHISIRGHTDSSKYAPGARYNNWDLSADRAQSSRRALTRNNYPEEKIETVVGRADRDHLIPENPLSPQNRRISIILLRDKLTRDTNASVEDLQQKLQQNNIGVTDNKTETTKSVIITKETDESSTQPPNNNAAPRDETNNSQARPTEIESGTKEVIILREETPAAPQKRVLEFP
jgi:chemotaxis protein MotB